jgi:hypothetical protein
MLLQAWRITFPSDGIGGMDVILAKEFMYSATGCNKKALLGVCGWLFIVCRCGFAHIGRVFI